MAKYSPKTNEELQELVLDESINLGDIDTSAIDDMSELFQNSERTDFSGIEKWDTSNVTSMRDMFNCAEHFNHNINDWDVSSVEDMAFMFEGTPFNQPLDKWDVSKVHTMDCMFNWAKAFNQDISMWDISSVETMESMFHGAENFNQNLDAWTPHAEIARIFAFSPLAYNPPQWFWDNHYRLLEYWDDGDDWESVMECEGDGIYTPKNLTELSNLVANKFIHLGNIDTSAIDDMSELFEESDRVIFDGIEKWDTSNVTSMYCMFSCAKYFNHNINDWDVSKVECMSNMFSNAHAFNQPLDKWNVSKVSEFSQMFAYATSFNQNISSWDMSSASDMSYMFAGAENFKQNLDKWAVKADEMTGAFNGSGLEDNPPKWYDASEFSDENWTDEVYYNGDEDDEEDYDEDEED